MTLADIAPGEVFTFFEEHSNYYIMTDYDYYINLANGGCYSKNSEMKAKVELVECYLTIKVDA